MTVHLANGMIERRGLMLILSSPSGAGKTTLTRLLRERDPSLTLSISVTTRQPRPSERDGVDYKFISVPAFNEMREAGQLLEWAEVHGNFYGSPKHDVLQALQKGNDILFDIDYQGALQVRGNAPTDVVSVFILPPSMKELERRLINRAEDSADTIKRRLRNSLIEMNRWPDYDYVIVNDDLSRAFDQVQAIIAAERLRRDRQTGLRSYVAGLLEAGAATSSAI